MFVNETTTVLVFMPVVLGVCKAGIKDPLSSYPRVIRWQDFLGISREMLAYPAYLF
jgi:hypothetical protein